ncbi:hypothetical protein RHSIM_Rhsim06G0013300 [Rhododendron simsii]|uniref:Uncharacterized protein n=1 Tax=Rhododendron simsii TaxID=118357 RepID=A0A834LMJ8_RHOSS|nr:hypothetical protein RHSIM_Rhsim06G0013300 [Rhododendron simsii]
MVNTARHSTGKASSLKSGESVDPHYLRASTGSCHDVCKYGRNHEVELKARKMTVVVKVKPKPSPVSKALSADSPSVIKEEVSSLSSDTVGFFQTSTTIHNDI